MVPFSGVYPGRQIDLPAVSGDFPGGVIEMEGQGVGYGNGFDENSGHGRISIRLWDSGLK